jgi:hypothetical protein
MKNPTIVPLVLLAGLWLASPALAKLPPPTEEAKAKAAETAARSAWSAKVAAYQLCRSMDKVAADYLTGLKQAGKPAPEPVATPPCTEPGPFAYTPPEAKPIEAAGAHSPAATATSPPNTTQTSAEVSPAKKP